jgi:dienelactone hydrolase
MIYQEFVLYSREGEKLRSDIRYEADGIKKPVILFLHGFKGFKDWGPFPTIRERLASKGFISVAFNFSHNGIGDDLQNFTELERFAENTFSRERCELSDVIGEIVRAENIPIGASEIHSDAIGLHGHSRGASVAILEAHRHRMIRAVSAWAPPSYFNRYSDRQKEQWRSQGYMEIENARTGQTMRLNVSLLDDIEKNKDHLDVIRSAKALTSQEKGLLLVAGSEDMTVKPEESQAIYDGSVKGFSELHIIPHTGHTFGAEHPKKEVPEPMETALAQTVNFFQRYLVQHPVPLPE